MTLLDIINRNTSKFETYNAFRKQIFKELAPVESEAVLYLLPWLLCINHPACPGYVRGKKYPFRLNKILQNTEIKERESRFKKKFGIKESSSLLNFDKATTYLEGVYSIGSIGSVNQTSSSDCDIWICYDKSKFRKEDWQHLNHKINIMVIVSVDL